MRLSNAGRSVRDVQAWPSGHLGDSTSRGRVENLMPGCRRLCEGVEMFWSRIVHCPSSTTPRDVLTSQGTSSHDTDGIDTDLFGLSAVARHTRRGACLGQDALKLCTELGFGLAGAANAPNNGSTPPRGCCRRGAVARSQARDCCRGCGIDRWGLEHAGDGMAGTGRMGLLEQRCRHRPSCARDVLCFLPQKKMHLSASGASCALCP